VGISTEKILHRLYPGANRPAGGRPANSPFLQSVKHLDPGQSPAWARRLFAWSCVALLVVWFAALWYYHNVFVAMTSTIDGDWADCEVMMQSRTHIRINLSHMIVAYAQHERDLMTKITELRVGKPLQPADAKPAADPAAADSPSAPGKPLNPAAVAKELEQLGPKQIAELLSRIQVVAEQYPQLKLTEGPSRRSSGSIGCAVRAERKAARRGWGCRAGGSPGCCGVSRPVTMLAVGTVSRPRWRRKRPEATRPGRRPSVRLFILPRDSHNHDPGD
jgi:hypothetical protein